jgi:hypothetical protein
MVRGPRGAGGAAAGRAASRVVGRGRHGPGGSGVRKPDGVRVGRGARGLGRRRAPGRGRRAGRDRRGVDGARLGGRGRRAGPGPPIRPCAPAGGARPGSGPAASPTVARAARRGREADRASPAARGGRERLGATGGGRGQRAPGDGVAHGAPAASRSVGGPADPAVAAALSEEDADRSWDDRVTVGISWVARPADHRSWGLRVGVGPQLSWSDLQLQSGGASWSPSSALRPGAVATAGARVSVGRLELTGQGVGRVTGPFDPSWDAGAELDLRYRLR